MKRLIQEICMTSLCKKRRREKNKRNYLLSQVKLWKRKRIQNIHQYKKNFN